MKNAEPRPSQRFISPVENSLSFIYDQRDESLSSNGFTEEMAVRPSDICPVNSTTFFTIDGYTIHMMLIRHLLTHGLLNGREVYLDLEHVRLREGL